MVISFLHSVTIDGNKTSLITQSDGILLSCIFFPVALLLFISKKLIPKKEISGEPILRKKEFEPDSKVETLLGESQKEPEKELKEQTSTFSNS